MRGAFAVGAAVSGWTAESAHRRAPGAQRSPPGCEGRLYDSRAESVAADLRSSASGRLLRQRDARRLSPRAAAGVGWAAGDDVALSTGREFGAADLQRSADDRLSAAGNRSRRR